MVKVSGAKENGDDTARKARATLGEVSTGRTPQRAVLATALTAAVMAVMAVMAVAVVVAGSAGGSTPAAGPKGQSLAQTNSGSRAQAYSAKATAKAKAKANSGVKARGKGHGRPARHSGAGASRTTSTTEPPVTPISWAPCKGDLQCGNLVVPLDYSDPRGPTIAIAVARHPAEDPTARIGSLVINPGGPGVSGVDDMANELSVLTPQVLDDFDIVMFDARGVERSDPVSCGTGGGGGPSDPVPTTASQVAATIKGMRQFAAACERNSPTLLPYVGSVDVARDMDRLRQALGDSGLTYMGQSYGTLLGLTYAALFPTHIRAMVLDSVIDPALSFDQITAGQAGGFEGVLNAFFSWCASASTATCPWRPSGDPTTALLALIRQSATTPAPGGGGGAVAGPGQIYDALLNSLYAQSDWPQLGATLAADTAGNGAPAVSQSNHYNNGGSSNADVAATAIDCVDHPVSRDLATYSALAYSLARSAPVFGPLLAWGEAGCAVWPAPPTRKVGPVAAPGSPPILLVGTTNDPATPYAWAVNVSKELDHAVLLTHDGDDHVAYFYSACVRADVQTYLVGGQTPAPGTTCTS
jgi:pimeloyl-ACP methyl ester carboxylesterase